MLSRLAPAMALVLTASCTAAPAPPTPAQQSIPFTPPEWAKPLPNTQLTLTDWSLTEAGWDNGLLLAASRDNVGDNGRQFIVYTSKDGRDWRETTPEGATGPGLLPYRMTAGYGAAGYLLGWGAQGLTVWRTENGEQWEAIPLATDDLDSTSPSELATSITAGPRGVLVVGADYSGRTDGIHVWHSADGRTFDAMTRITAPADAKLSPTGAAEATSSGFVLTLRIGLTTGDLGQILLTSEDGARWQDITAGLSRTLLVSHMSGNASTVVAFAFQPGPETPSEPLTWYRRDGAWHPAKVDPGRLPDAGVVPASQRIITAVRNWGAGFIAIGYSINADSREDVGLVWYSADGAEWTRMPVRDNGFDTADRLMDVAATKENTVLLGTSPGLSVTLLMWRAQAPPHR